MKRTAQKTQGGFTLIEVLVVIGIIAVLAAIVIIAINPARQFAQARDTQRTSNLNAILNAVGQRVADNKGKFDGDVALVGGGTKTCAVLPNASTTIDLNGTGTGINLDCLVPTYISALPLDPTAALAEKTGYKIVKSTDGRIHVFADAQELDIPRTAAIEVIR